jgi:hypothetical protein
LNFTGARVDRQPSEARHAHEHVAAHVVFAEAQRKPIAANAGREVQIRNFDFSVARWLDAKLDFDLIPSRGLEDQLSGAVLDEQMLDPRRVEAMAPLHFVGSGGA